MKLQDLIFPAKTSLEFPKKSEIVNPNGFTLLELIVSIAIFGSLIITSANFMYSAQEDGVVRKVKEFETQTRVFFNLLPPMVKIDNYSSSSMSILSERNAKEALNKVDF